MTDTTENTGTGTGTTENTGTGTTENTGAAESTGDVQGPARAYRKTQLGFVVSDKMDKTIVVEVEERMKHSLYGKVQRKTKKFKAHDEQNTAGIGDRVVIMETRPLSATKRWRLVEVLERAQ